MAVNKISLGPDGKPIVELDSSASSMAIISGQFGLKAEVRDPIEKQPDLSGPHGKAWSVDTRAGMRELGVSEENDATIASWVVEAPWAHPAWHSYHIISIHLRPMSDERKTIFHKKGATHELWVFAMDARKGRLSLIEKGVVRGHWLSPMNFGSQYTERSDESARERIKSTVREILDGKLSPDTDFRHEWVRRFGDNMVKKAYRS